MNFKKMISVALVVAITITLLPIKYGVKVHAAITGYTTYNSDNTDIPNKYGITGTIYATKKYSDLTAVVSGNSLYIIRNGSAEFYTIDSSSQNFSTNFSFLRREGNKLYIYEYSYDNPKLITFDIDSKTFNAEPVSGYFVNDGANGRYIRDAVIDNNGVQWYMASEQTSSGTNKTLLTQVNIDKSLKQYDLTNVSGQFGLWGITADSNNNLWMVTTPDVSGAMKAYENIKTTCLSKFNNGQITVFHQFTQDNGVFDYKVTPSGDVWLLIGLYPNGQYSGVKMEHLSSSGSVLGDYSVDENVRDIKLDSHGGVWISDGQHIMKFENNQFVTKYTLTDNRSDFDVLDDNNISANSSVGITLINSGQMENVNKESLVKDNAFIVKDNLGNIKLLSRSDYVYVNDVSNGKFSQPKKVPELSGIYLGTARGNNGSIYLYNNNQIFKYDGTSAYVYSQFNLQSGEYIKGMEMMSTGEIYIQTNKNLIMIDKNKNVSTVDIISGLKLDSSAQFLNSKLVVDKNNNMYFQLYYKVGYNYSTKLYKINNLSAIVNSTPVVGTLEYENAFTNENNDLEYVFYKAATYPNQYYGAYYYGADGTLVEDSRFVGLSNTISSDFINLKKVEKTSDNKLIIYAYSDNIYVRDLNSQTIVKQSSFTNGTLAADERGGVYVGGYSSTGLLYFYPSDMRTTINISGIAHLGVYTEVTPNITVTNGDVRKILIDDKPFINGTKYAVNGYHVMNIEVRDYKGDTMQEVLGFTIDLTPPTIDINGAEDGGVYSQTHFNVYTTDSDGKITNVLLNGQPYNGEEISTPGDYTINASAIDNLGNKSEKTIKFYIRANASQINNAGDEIISNPTNTGTASTIEEVGGTTTSTDSSSTIVKVDEDKASDAIFNTRALIGKLRGKVSESVLDALSNIIISAAQSSGTNKIEVPISSNFITKAGDSDLGILFKLGNVNLQIPDGAVNVSDYSKDAVFNISKQDINGDEAASMLKSKPSMLNQVGNIFDFGITVNQAGKETAAIHQFSNGKKVAVTIELTADQLKNVDVSRLSAYYFNETTNKWEEVGGTFDKATNKFTFQTTHFSKYTLMEKSGTLPKTGQLIDMNMLIISGIAMMFAGCLLTMKRRKTN